MFSADSLAIIRIATFGTAGLICTTYAIGILLFGPSFPLPHWLPPVVGGCVAVVFFLAVLCADTQDAVAALDESYTADRRTAAVAGFWSALGMGTALWLTGAGGSLQLAITLTGASAVFLLTQVALDLRGWAWR